MTDLTAVSLFAGVEGIGTALERAGVNVVAAVEIDPAARGVIADHYPHLALFDDVTKVTGDQLRDVGFVPERGILAGGFPCQDLSVAGRRRGMGEGTRSGLFWHVDRLMAELHPAWVLLENVPGLLSSTCPCPGDGLCVDNGQTTVCDNEPHPVKAGACVGGCIATHGGAMGAVLGSLGHRGYGFAYRVLDAQFFGVPQRRRRVFIVGHLGDRTGPVQVLLEPEGSTGDSAPGVPPRPRAATDAAGGVAEAGRVVTALTTKAGNTFDDQQTGQLVTVGTLTSSAGGVGASERTRRQPATSSRSVVMALTSNGVGTCGPDDNQAQAGHLIATHTHTPRTFQKVIRSGARDVNGDLPAEVWAERDIAATLNLNDLGSESRAVELVVQPMAVRGRSDGADLEIAPDGDPYFALRAGDGGSSRSQLVSITGPVTHALTSEGADASEDGTGRGTPIIGFSHTAGLDEQSSERVFPTIKAGHDGMPATATAVRRLTPLECERLQGFPDGWTAHSNGKAQADGPRYRQMGNAVAVPVVEWIAHRLVAIDAQMREES